MSRGPGRMQRELLALLAEENVRGDKVYGQHRRIDGQRVSVRREADEWTTTDLCSAYDRAHPDWWWDHTSERQVRRALDALHRVGRVNKRLIEGGVFNGVGAISLWRLKDASPSADEQSAPSR